jgi:hypothetical protein
MATTITLQNSINYAQPVLKSQPLLVSNFEPALTMANIVLGTMLGAPFKWRFNRNSFTLPITGVDGTDYSVALPDMGFLECQWLVDGNAKIYELKGDTAIAKQSATGRPLTIAMQYDDNAGNVTFRVDRVPDQDYIISGDYQKKAVQMTSPGSPWGVVPDEFGYLFNNGFLAMAMLLVNDSRFPIFDGYFVNRLLGAQDGLSEQQRDIFVGNWTRQMQTLKRADLSTQIGIAGRAK